MIKTMLALPAILLLLSLISADAELVEYKFEVYPRRATEKDSQLSPDCAVNNKVLLLVNDQLPGVMPIRAKVGDTVRLTVQNNSPTDVLTVHMHGLTMKGQPYIDGVSSVTQCGSPPLSSQAYEFEVFDVGTHYWHGHVSFERSDGMQGPIIITDPESEEEMQLEEMYDDEAVVFLQDWYHAGGQMRRTGLDTNPFIWIGDAQSFLINGGGIYSPCLDAEEGSLNCASDCSASNYIKDILVEEGKTYRLRLISGAELIGFNFAIPGHKMTIVEVEGTIVEPVVVDNLDIVPGARFSVLVKADQAPGNYLATTKVRYRSSGPMGYINLRYSGVTDEINIENATLSDHPAWDDAQAGLNQQEKLLTKSPSSFDDADVLTANPDSIRRLIIVGTQANDEVLGMLRWAFNNVTMHLSGEPLITTAYEAVNAEGAKQWPNTEIPSTVVVPDKPPTTFDYHKLVQGSVGTFNGERGRSYIALEDTEFVEVVFQNALALNGVAEMHSHHLHGHSFWVVGQGFGTFDEATDPETYNLVNPVRRDTVTLLPKGWVAFRFRPQPGVWAFHCSQNAHLVMGMGLNFIVSPDKLGAPPPASTSCLHNGFNPEALSAGAWSNLGWRPLLLGVAFGVSMSLFV
ncbi:hypothetical protein THAOC_10148 [Thalassiosira oceanica]|uniref:L-ascorbate oxidase n=1 Tax=Thalassiosira oceanica TaxID=159749 RepID=K0SUQ1_THAOC|nr:hypothetical protein THAOC_10148 [Thalassiosira oceanica]|eukprot:EJK68654.1 hypothetical protein THAOC_10148 [Thalassiosira oceanica]